MLQKLKILFLLGLLILPTTAWANNLTVSNVALVDPNDDNGTVNIQFDISWDNSWRNSINRDAVWVFAKYSEDSGATWSFCTLYGTAGTNPTGFSQGTGTALDIRLPTDKLGVMIERTNVGAGSIDTDDIEIPWNYVKNSVAATASVRIQLFAIEMVYIPTGSFYIGDGNGTLESSSAFHQTENTAVQITTTMKNSINIDANLFDEDQIESPGIGIDGDGGIDTDNDTTVDNANFPTGYAAFYIMKYEITQGQYTAFLNTLTRTQQDRRTASDVTTDAITNIYVMSNAASSTNRDMIICPASGNGTTDPITFSCTRGDRACNYLSVEDICAYADWSGLRPITELEFEKACRGTKDAILSEYAWGSTTINGAAANEIDPDAAEDGDETISNLNANACYGQVNFTTGDTGTGPLRVGLFAESSTDRQASGASYYGVMELSGNVNELCVTVGKAAGQAFDGSHGDATLAANGDDDETWPSNSGFGRRGGSHDDAVGFEDSLYVSSRDLASASSGTRSAARGGRLARTE